MPLSGMTFKSEVTLNTLISVATLLTIVFGGGYAWSQAVERIAYAQERISQLDARVAAVEAFSVRVSNIETRQEIQENASRKVEEALRTSSITLNQLGIDTRVTREILERVERGINGGNSRGSGTNTQ